jgi:hypothetical protein
MDQRALNILFDAFWSSGRWSLRGVAPSDFAYAKSKGLMFDPVRLNHSEAVGELLTTVKQLGRRRVANAFLASLSTRRLDWRSALGSYAVFQHLTAHSPDDSERCCAVCGFYFNKAEEDLNALNFERLKWGGVRHDQVGYARFDLKLFLDSKVPEPTEDDVRIFRDIIAAIAAGPPETTSAGLHSHFAKVIKSNKAERDIIVSILGFCGILGTPEHPGFADSFIHVSERRLPDRRFVDMQFPACWWQGSVGLNKTKLAEFFGHAL